MDRRILPDRQKKLKADLGKLTYGTTEYDIVRGELAVIEGKLREPEPQLPRLLVHDATPEALAEMLPKHRYRLACIADEDTLLEVLMGRYTGDTNMNLLLRAWSGEGGPVDRKAKEPIMLPEAYLTLGFCIQPDPLKKVASNPAGKGFFERFLSAVPADIRGTRKQVMEGMPAEVQEDWNDSVLLLFDRPERRLRHSKEGWEFLQSVEAGYEPRMAATRELSPVAEWVSKAVPGQLLRTAAVLHCASDTGVDIVPVETLRAASKIVEYFLAHALHISGVSREDHELAAAQDILERILIKKIPSFMASHWANVVWKYKQDKEILEYAYGRLVAANIIRAAKKDDKGKITRFDVNPNLRR